MAEFNISKIRFKWKGTWASATAYIKDDIIRYGGRSYVAEEPHTSSASFETDLNASLWTVVTDGRQWRDEWQSSTLYRINDIILRNGAVYICIGIHTSTTTFEDNSSDWQLLIDSDGWESEWQSSTKYSINTVVRYNGIVYRCITAHQSSNRLENDQEKWEVLYEGVQYVGDWAESTTYRVNDLAKYGGSVWRCKIGHTSGDDSTINFNEIFWDLEIPGKQFRGEWNEATVYVPGDIVRYGGYLYSAVLSTIGINPPLETSADWILISKNYNFRGDWSASGTYRPGDVVRRGASLYVSTADQLPTKNAGTKTFTVTVGDPKFGQTGGKFYIDGEYRPILNLEVGWTYIFDQSDLSNRFYPTFEPLIINSRPFLFSADAFNGEENNGTLYSDNVRYRVDILVSTNNSSYLSAMIQNVGTLFQVEITITEDTPDLYYYSLYEINYGGYVHITPANSGGDPVDDPTWVLLTESNRFRNSYQNNVEYVQGDVVRYKESTWLCTVTHISDELYNFPDNGNGVFFWDLLVEGDPKNGLATLGDIATYGIERDGSTLGSIPVPIGNPEELLMVNQDQTLFYKKWGFVPKVFYVAPQGVDEPNRGTTLNEPWKTVRYATENVTGPATIFVKTGLYRETLPIIVPADVAIVGDELRSSRIEPAPAVPELANDVSYTIAVLNRMKDIVGNIVKGTSVTKTTGNTENQITTIFPSGDSAESQLIGLIDNLIEYIDFHINSNGTEPSMTGSNTANTDEEFVNATLALEANKAFLAAEAVAYMEFLFPAYDFDPELCKRDVRAYIDAWKYDLIYTGNYKTLLAGRYYRNAVLGSETEDMFYVRNASGIRNMTLAGLNGVLTPNGTLLVDQRPTAGAFVSLDPGWGPDDENVWIITRSPYIQNVTTFGQGCVGQKVDGALHNGGNKSIVSNDFTQVLSDGIGAWITNNGRVELVSVFTYYNHIGYLSENGGKIRATNGNNSYGNFGSVADGFDSTEVPLTAKVDNRNQHAIVESAFAGEANDELLVFEYKNAGEEYTTASFSILSSGVGANVVGNEFRDEGVFNVRLINPLDSSVYTAGGFGYTVQQNNAQGGNTLEIQLASNDTGSSADYVGLRLIIISGTGTGQYGYIHEFDEPTKTVTIRRESDETAGWDHVIPGYPAVPVLDTTTLYRIEPRITFSEPAYSAVGSTVTNTSTWKDLTYIQTRDTVNDVFATAGTGTTVDVPLANATFNVVRNGSKYSVTLANGGAGYNRNDVITISGIALGGASPVNDITITVTSTTEDSTNSILTFEYEGRGRGGNFVAIASNTNQVNYSADGSVWTGATTPTTENWSALASGNIGSFSFVVGVAFGGTRAVSSTDGGVTWTNRTLPSSTNWIDVAYGDSEFMAISEAGNVALSINGITWTPVASLPALVSGTAWQSIVYGKGRWVAIARGATSTQAAYSTNDGSSWISATMPSANSWISIAYGNNRFVAVAANSTSIAYSFDAITWNSSTRPGSGSTAPTIAYGQGLFLTVLNNSTTAYSSEDCQTWTPRSLVNSLDWSSVIFGNPNNEGRWAIIANNSDITNLVTAGSRAKGRAVVTSSVISSVRIWEPGSNYNSAPSLTFTDPSNSAEAVTLVRIGKGVLAQPTFISRGSAYRTSTTTVTISGDGYADVVPVGKFITVNGLERYPRPGANLTFNGTPNVIYRIVIVEELGGIEGYLKSRLRIEPLLKEVDNIDHNETITIRERYSQVRLTGHDFLEIGSGNFEQTNYPRERLGVLAPENEVFLKNGGRVFYTSTDQDGNFRVGELFAVEQATGTVTISADFFDLQGLTELSLGGVRLGGTGAVIREFSTDPLFTADSNNVVPTQKAIKAYLNSRLTTGGSEVSTGSITAGLVKVGPAEITTTTGAPIELPRLMNISGNQANLSGLIIAQAFFLRDPES